MATESPSAIGANLRSEDGGASTQDPLVGAVLAGSYRLTRLLATGGMGRVYAATHERLERKLVVKVLHEGQAHSKAALERAEREARTTSGISSDHVVELIDFVRADDGRPAIVMPFLEGEDLQDRLTRVGKLPIHEAVAIAIEISRGIAAAHAAGIIHRDLKPSNVFLTRTETGAERAMILDFGVAKVTDKTSQLTHTGSLVGTPAYMAPEQALRASNVDTRADIYAVGAVLYHMLTGQPPYGHEDATATLMGLLRGDPTRARDVEKRIPEGLEAVLEHAMARDIERRIPNAMQLIAELTPYAAPAFSATRSAEMPLDAPRSTSVGVGARARFARPLAVLSVFAASLAAGAFVAAFSSAIVRYFSGPGRLEASAQVLLPIVPVVVAIGLLCAGVSALKKRWRSAPEIERLAEASQRAMSLGFATLGAGALALMAYYGLLVSPALPSYLDVIVGVGVAGIIGIAVFARLRERG